MVNRVKTSNDSTLEHEALEPGRPTLLLTRHSSHNKGRVEPAHHREILREVTVPLTEHLKRLDDNGTIATIFGGHTTSTWDHSGRNVRNPENYRNPETVYTENPEPTDSGVSIVVERGLVDIAHHTFQIRTQQMLDKILGDTPGETRIGLVDKEEAPEGTYATNNGWLVAPQVNNAEFPPEAQAIYQALIDNHGEQLYRIPGSVFTGLDGELDVFNVWLLMEEDRSRARNTEGFADTYVSGVDVCDFFGMLGGITKTESPFLVAERAEDLVTNIGQYLAAQPTGTNPMMVLPSHGEVINAFVQERLGYCMAGDTDFAPEKRKPQNCEMLAIQYRADGSPEVGVIRGIAVDF